jgi:DNA-binding response OmpR family regulator
MSAVALISDLVMQSHVAAAAERAGASVVRVSSNDALIAKLTDEPRALVILDLSHPGLDPSVLVPQVRELLPPGGVCLAFGPHVHTERLAAAAEAGADMVISRGQFHAQVDELLRRYAG